MSKGGRSSVYTSFSHTFSDLTCVCLYVMVFVLASRNRTLASSSGVWSESDTTDVCIKCVKVHCVGVLEVCCLIVVGENWGLT